MNIPDFLNNEEIKELVASGNLEQVYAKLYYNCSDLTKYLINLDINPLEYFNDTIPSYAFAGLMDIFNVTIPNNIKVIGPGAFDGCSNLSELELSDNLTKIRFEAFRGCESLTQIKFPKSLKHLESGCFRECYRLVRIEYDSTINDWYKIGKKPYWKDATTIKLQCTDGIFDI